MKLEELFMTGLINDKTVIIVSKPFMTYGIQYKRRGNWYQDHILDLSEEDIRKLVYDAEKDRMEITLEEERTKG